MADHSPMRVRLSPERRADVLTTLKSYYAKEFDDVLSDFRADGLVDFFIRALGAPIYNQGVHDAAGAMQTKLADLEGEVYEPESRLKS